MYYYYRTGTGAVSVGSSITRDLRYDMVIHSLSPMLQQADGDRTGVISRHYTQVPGRDYLRCNGHCANPMLTYCPDLDSVGCQKHTVCFHKLQDCKCEINGSRVSRESSLYMLTHSAYYIPHSDLLNCMPHGAIACLIYHDIEPGTALTDT